MWPSKSLLPDRLQLNLKNSLREFLKDRTTSWKVFIQIWLICFVHSVIPKLISNIRWHRNRRWKMVQILISPTWYVSVVFLLVSWDWVRPSPLGTPATNWPILPAPDDRWWVWISRWNENWQGKPKYSETTCHSVTLFTRNPTWPDVASNSGRRGGKPATRVSYDTACMSVTIIWYFEY
jgi:hypothetical protein